MRVTIQTLLVGLSIAVVAGCAGSRCLHRPCSPECARSFDDPSPFAATVRSTRASILDRFRRWERDEEARDVTVRPEETPIPGEHVVRRPRAAGLLDLPPVTADDDEAD